MTDGVGVVGGCDSVSIFGLANRSLVAYRCYRCIPGLRSACKAGQRSPGANRCRHFVALEKTIRVGRRLRGNVYRTRLPTILSDRL
jgi:hypothetical protein